jgi:hypothetical protein
MEILLQMEKEKRLQAACHYDKSMLLRAIRQPVQSE